MPAGKTFVKTADFYIEKYTFRKPMSDMHCHNSYELYYIIDGEREYFIGDRFFKAEKGDFVTVPAGMLHRTAGLGATRILIFFTDDFLDRYFSREMTKQLKEKYQPAVIRPDGNTRAYAFHLMEQLLLCGKNQTESAALLFSLLHLLGTASVKSLCNTYGNIGKQFENIISRMNEKCTEINTLEEIIGDAYISKYYFCRLFKKQLGVTPVSYLRTLKIRAACGMLADGDKSIAEISEACGFCSPSYFSLVFGKETGVKPVDYRKMHGKSVH